LALQARVSFPPFDEIVPVLLTYYEFRPALAARKLQINNFRKKKNIRVYSGLTHISTLEYFYHSNSLNCSSFCRHEKLLTEVGLIEPERIFIYITM
jgi:hypothetical protein